MAKLLMISGDRMLARGQRGAFYRTLQGLQQHFERIDVLCPQVPGIHGVVQPFPGVFVHASPVPLALQWWWIWRAGIRLIGTHKHDVMTVHEYPPFYNGIGARLIYWSTRVPYLLEIMHIPGVPHAADVREWLYRGCARFFLVWDAAAACAVRVINRTEVPHFLARAGVPERKVLVVPAFYIDRAIFAPQSLERRYDCLFVGRLVPGKGADMFVAAVARAGVRGCVVGAGPLRSRLERLARQLHADIEFVGFAPDAAAIASYMNASRMLVVPSLSEGGPRVVLEALACGIPVLATRVGIVPDVLPDVAIIPWEVPHIAERITRLLQDADCSAQIVAHGASRLPEFEYERSIGAYADAIRSCAAL